MTSAAARSGSDGRHVRTGLLVTVSNGGGDVMVSARALTIRLPIGIFYLKRPKDRKRL
jgi:hypothetical protein